jgi:hypothetical protein
MPVRALLLCTVATLAGGATVALADSPSGSSSPVAGVVTVHSRTCPKSHPHKLGSVSYRSMRIVDGKVERHSYTGSICAK